MFRDADGTEHRVSYRVTRTGTSLPEDAGIIVVSATPDRVNLEHEAVMTSFMVARYGENVYVDSPLGSVSFTSVPRFPVPGSEIRQGSLLAPMPGSVIRLGADLGDTVAAGQPLIWLEAMKMEHTITAPAGGVLTQICVAVGQQVEVGAVLARVETQGDGDD